MESSMSTVFKFVFESAGGGSTPENVAAQTGDWLTMLLVALFAVAAIASLIFAFVKVRGGSNFTKSASHAAIKTATHSKTIVAVIIAALAIAGICVSVANAPALRAFANGNAADVDYKPQITATVHEDTQTVTFEQNYFRNLDSDGKPIHIDHSSLTLSNEAKTIIGEEDIYFEAKYVGEETRVFAGDADPSEDCKPVDQDALPYSQTQNIEYNTNITYEIAKKLCDIEEAFTLDLVPAECVTVTYDKGDAESGEAPHSQTVSKSTELDMEQYVTYAPANTGNLAKSGYEFIGWTDETGSVHYTVGQEIDPANADVKLVPEWKYTAGYALTFEAATGGTIDKTQLTVEPNTLIKTDGTAIFFGETSTAENTVTATPTIAQHYQFDKWVYVNESTETDLPEKVTAAMTFRAKFTYETYTLTFDKPAAEQGTIAPESLTDKIAYNTPIKFSGTDSSTIFFGAEQTISNAITATANTDNHYLFDKWVIVVSGSEQEIAAGAVITGATTFRAKFKLETFEVSFAAGENGNVYEAGTTTAPTTQTVPYGATWSISETETTLNYLIISWKEGQTDKTYKVQPVADPYYKFKEWTNETPTNAETAITSNIKFTATFEIQTATLTYKVVDEENAHGAVSETAQGEEKTSISETIPVNATEAQVKGAYARESTKVFDKLYKYYFYGWTEGDKDVTPSENPTILKPKRPSSGVWADTTYIVHFATPRAIYSEDPSTGDKILNFTFDEEKHNEAYQSNVGDGNKYKFVVNNSEFNLSDPKAPVITVPSWYEVAKIGPSGITQYPSPKVNPTRVKIDSTFKRYKYLTSTDMWFMDSGAIPAMQVIMSESTKISSSTLQSLEDKQLKSVEGLENLPTSNLKSANLMFANGKTVLDQYMTAMHMGSLKAEPDKLTSIDLSSWTELDNLDGDLIGMFAGCNSLTELILPGGNFGAKSKDLSGMFAGCTSLTTFTAQGNFGESVENAMGMFFGCSGLKEFALESSTNANSSFGKDVKSLKYMFIYCTSLNRVNLSTCNPQPEIVDDLFYADDNIVTMILPDGWNFTSNAMGLDTGSKWYKYDPTTKEYKEIEETKIETANGGILTRYSAKAVYNDSASTLIFYYDFYIHDEGTVFSVDLGQNSKNARFFPDWYDAKLKIDGELIPESEYTNIFRDTSKFFGKSVTSDIKLMAPANTVVFDNSFANVENLTSINCWFIADSYGHTNCFQEFYSYDVATGSPSPENKGFKNLCSDNLISAVNVFGGFSFETIAILYASQGKAYDTNSDLEQYFGAADTFSTRTGELDLSTFNMSSKSSNITAGLCCNATGLSKIIVPLSVNSSLMAGMFMNCSSLTQVEGKLNTSKNRLYAKMFYNCASLESLDLGSFDTTYISKSLKDEDAKKASYNMFGGCYKLNTLILPNTWTLNGSDCNLPNDSSNPWHNKSYEPTKSFSPSEIPSFDENGKPIYIGEFYRNKVTEGKTVTVSVEGTGGVIYPEVTSFTIYGPTNYFIEGNSLHILDRIITAVPDDGNRVKSWKINDERVSEVAVGNYQGKLDYVDGNKFAVGFTEKAFQPKAVYDEDTSTLTFYYDKETHAGEGTEVFDVYDNTFVNINMETGNIFAKLPAWYDYELSNELGENPEDFIFDISLKINAENVVFSKSFANYDDLESISMWFMADSHGKQTFKNFYSPDESGQLTEATKGFANLNTSNLKDVKFTFGGFSMLPLLMDILVKQLNFSQAYISAENGSPTGWEQIKAQAPVMISMYSMWDKFGTSFDTIDLSTFDIEHHLKDYTAMFCNCRNLSQVIFSDDIGSANITNMTSMFQNCENFGLNPSVDNPIVNMDKFDTSNVTNMNLMFYGDFGLKKLDLSNFDTRSCLKLDGALSKMDITMNNWFMFYDCTRLSDITVSSQFDLSARSDDLPIYIRGWAIPLGVSMLPDTVNSEGNVNYWSNNAYPDHDTWLTNNVPYSLAEYLTKALSGQDPSGTVYTGNFTRAASIEYKTVFKTEDKAKGFVNGKESVDYVYIKNDTVRLDPNDTTSLLSDNYKLTPEPANDNYRFSHWEYLDTPESTSGSVVTAQDEFYFEADGNPENVHTFVAVFEDAKKTAKAVYTKPAADDPDKVATMTFVYDDNEDYPEGTVVWKVKPNTDMYNLPPWYDKAGKPEWVSGENREMREFVDEIDDGTDNVPSLIKVNFDESFAQYKELTSLSGWFAPGLSKKDSHSSLYQPFIFGDNDDGENCFSGLQNINTTSIYNVEYMFGGHENSNEISGSHVTSIDLTGFDQGVEGIYEKNSLKNINGLFSGCLDLETLTLPNDFGASCTSMSKTFFNCKKLVGDKLVAALTNLNTSSVVDMSYMFARYKNVISPNGYGVEDITTLKFPKNFDTNHVLSIEGMFAGYTDTKFLVIDSETERTIETKLQIQNADKLFANTTNFTSNFLSVNINNSPWLNTSTATTLRGLFMNHDNLTDLSFIGLNSASISTGESTTDLSYMFSGCTKLAQLNWGNKFDTSRIIRMDHMFEGTAFGSFNLSSNDDSSFFSTKSLLYCSYMFSECSNLKTANLMRDYNEEFPIIDARWMFMNCNVLEHIQLSGFYVFPLEISDEGDPTDTRNLHWPAENMFSLNNNGEISDNASIIEVDVGPNMSPQIKDAQGKIVKNHRLDNTGLVNYDPETYELAKWYLKQLPSQGAYYLSDLVDMTANSIYTLTWKTPNKITVQANKEFWGSVNNSMGEDDCILYYGSLSVKAQAGTNNLSYSYSEVGTFNLSPQTSNKSSFEKWQVIREGKTEEEAEDIPTNGTPVMLTGNDTIIAVFKDGLEPYVAIVNVNGAKTINPNINVSSNDLPRVLYLLLVSESEIEDYIKAGVIVEGEYWEIPSDGDWGAEGAPYLADEQKIKYGLIAIDSTLKKYNLFTTFKGWFKGLDNLSGDIFGKELMGENTLQLLNFTNVTDMSEMFSGCSGITDIVFNNLISLPNETKINTKSMFEGCTSLKNVDLGPITNYSDQSSNVFKGCSSIESMSFNKKFNKKLSDLGLDQSKQFMFANQNTLQVYNSSNILDAMPSVSVSKRGYICAVNDKVTLTSTGSFGYFSDKPSGTFTPSLDINFNGDTLLKASVASSGATATVYYEANVFDTTVQWSVVIYRQDQNPEEKMFYYWQLNEDVLETVPVTLTNNDTFTAIYDVPKEMFAIYDSSQKSLTFKFEANPPDKAYSVPNEWSKDSEAASNPVSPWKELAGEVESVVIENSFKDSKQLYDVYAWFKDFTKLTSVEGLGNLYLSGSSPSFNMTFYGCSSLNEVDFTGIDANYSNETFVATFSDCKTLAEVDLSPFTLSSKVSEDATKSMFNGCTGLNKISFGSGWLQHPLSSCGYVDYENWFWINDDTGQNVGTKEFPNVLDNLGGTFVKGVSKTNIQIDSTEQQCGTLLGPTEVVFDTVHTATYQLNDDNSLSIFVKGSGENSFEHKIIAKKNKGYMIKQWELDGQVLTPETGIVKGGSVFTPRFTPDPNAALAVYDSTTSTLIFKYEERAKETLPYMDVPYDWSDSYTSPFIEFKWNYSIQHVVFDQSFINVDGITSLRAWFREFNIESITGFEYINSSQVNDISNLFNSCLSLKSLDVTKFDTSNVVNMSNTFDNLRTLETFVSYKDDGTSKFKTDKVNDFSYNFYLCDGLKTLDLRGWDIDGKGDKVNVEAFITNCELLEVVNLSLNSCCPAYAYANDPRFWPFGYCYNVNKIISNGKFNINYSSLLGYWKTPSGYETNGLNQPLTEVGNYEKAFALTFNTSDAYGGEVVCEPDVNPILFYSSEEDASYSYDGEKVVVTITDKNVNENRQYTITPQKKVDSYSFNNWNLDPAWEVNVPITTNIKFTANFVDENHGRAYFDTTDGINTLTFYYDNTERPGMSYVDVPKNWSPYKNPEASPFAAYSQTCKKVVIDQSFFNFGGIQSLYRWFDGFINVTSYEGLEYLNLADLKSSDPEVPVTDYERPTGTTQMFNNNHALESLDIYKLNLDDCSGLIWHMREMFQNCYKLKNLNLVNPNDGTSKFNISYAGYNVGMFKNCRALKSVDLSYHSQFDRIEQWNYAAEVFKGCVNLEKVDMGPIGIGGSFDSFFEYCYSLRDFKVGKEFWFEKSQIFSGMIKLQGGNWKFSETPESPESFKSINMYNQSAVMVGEYKRDEETVNITFKPQGEGSESGYVLDKSYEGENNITTRPVPAGTLAQVSGKQECRLIFKDNYGISWDLGSLYCESYDYYTYKYWSFGDTKPITQTDSELSYMITNTAPTMLQYQTDPNEELQWGSEDSEDANGAAAALLAAGPALAALGLRKRIRGKHVRIK